MTLQEVAKRAGVSTATASRVLSGAGNVRESTRRRVEAAARQLCYSPNVHASTLAKGSSRILGVVVSNVNNPFFLDIFREIEAAAVDAGYAVMLEHTGYDPDRLAASVRLLRGLRTSGLALIVSEMDAALLDDIRRTDLPTVVYDTEFRAKHISSIRVQYGLAMRRVVEYLHGLGHRRMAFIGHHAALAPLQARKQTFVDTMRQYASDAEFACAEHEDSPRGGKAAAARLLDTGFLPSAILCTNDFMAIGVLRELRERGLSVPDQVSVTGFDNILFSEFTDPPLTTLNIPRDRIGRLCFEALTQAERNGPPADMVVEPELVVRGSTAPFGEESRRQRRRAASAVEARPAHGWGT